MAKPGQGISEFVSTVKGVIESAPEGSTHLAYVTTVERFKLPKEPEYIALDKAETHNWQKDQPFFRVRFFRSTGSAWVEFPGADVMFMRTGVRLSPEAQQTSASAPADPTVPSAPAALGFDPRDKELDYRLKSQAISAQHVGSEQAIKSNQLLRDTLMQILDHYRDRDAKQTEALLNARSMGFWDWALTPQGSRIIEQLTGQGLNTLQAMAMGAAHAKGGTGVIDDAYVKVNDRLNKQEEMVSKLIDKLDRLLTTSNASDG